MKKTLSIKSYFQNILFEDLNLKEANPNLAGLYAFCQAINKVGNQSPFPVPTIDIIPTNETSSFGYNPVHFSFSKNSFKVYINPKIGRVDLDDGGGHDLMHALTTNIAKKFGRERKGADFDRTTFRNSPFKMSSLANLSRVSPKSFESIAKELAEFGIDFKSLKSPNDIKNAMNTLAEKERKAYFDVAAGADDPSTIKKTLALSKLLPKLSRTHFSPSLKTRGVDKIANVSKRKYEQEYGITNDDNSANYGLPQYEAEENFGNSIAFAIQHFISDGRPIETASVLEKLQKAVEEDPSELGQFLQDSWYGRLEKFLESVFETYNQLLPKYASVMKKKSIE